MKTRKILILAALVIFSSHADVEKRRGELLNVIDEELKEVTRLNKQVGTGRPDLLLRLAQVLHEKARLIKENENARYLDISVEQRSKINKDDFFKESKRYFEESQKTCSFLTKKFPTFKDKGSVYYILAYNAKEFRKEEEAKKYFSAALKSLDKDSLTYYKSQIALGELYFNSGNYDKARDVYAQALKSKRDKWWTKDAFNLSWSYFKTGDTEKGINQMLEAYEVSKNPKFIDMSASIERDIALLYTEAGRVKDVITFYQKNNKNVSQQLVRVGKYLKGQGKFQSAEMALSTAAQYRSTPEDDVAIYSELIVLYDRSGKTDKHLESCLKLSEQIKAGLLSVEQNETLAYHANKMGALYQTQVTNKNYDHLPDVRNKKAQDAVAYFKIAALAEPTKAQLHYFHAGETLFAKKDFDGAVSLYVTAIDWARKNNDKNTESEAVKSLMVSLSDSSIKKETVDQYLIPAYEGFLSSNPKGEKSAVVYQRLFSQQLKNKNIKQAEETFQRYRLNFPQDQGPHEKMVAEIMDYYKDRKDTQGLMTWAKQIENGQINVSPEYASKVKTLVLGLQFENVENVSQSGDKKGALKGYYQIYRKPESTDEAKKHAAYNIAVLMYEVGDPRQMEKWAYEALKLMSASDVLKFENEFVLMTTDLFQRRQFKGSASLSERLLDKVCSVESKNKRVFFKNANVLYLADKEFEKSRALMSKGQKCNVDQETYFDGQMDLLNNLAEADKWSSFQELVTSLESQKKMWGRLIYPTALLAREMESMGRVDEASKLKSKMSQYYQYAKAEKIEIPIDGLEEYSTYLLEAIEKDINSMKAITLNFPEAEYNKKLKSKFSYLDKIANDLISVIKIGAGPTMMTAYRLMIEAHESLIDEISNFVPSGKSSDYISSFRKSMTSLTAPLAKQVAEYRDQAFEKMDKETIISKDNFFFTAKGKGFSPGYSSDDPAMVMDRGGAK